MAYLLLLNRAIKGEDGSFTVEVSEKGIVSHLKNEIKPRKSAFTNMDAFAIKVWRASYATTEKNIRDVLKAFTTENKDPRGQAVLENLFLPSDGARKGVIHIIVDEARGINNVINETLLNLAGFPAKELDDMPLTDRDFKDAISLITNNVKTDFRESKSKSDFHMLASGGGKLGLEENCLVALKKTGHLRLTINGIRLVETDYNILESVIIDLRIAYCYFVEGKYDMDFEVFHGRIKEKNSMFSITSVSYRTDFGSITRFVNTVCTRLARLNESNPWLFEFDKKHCKDVIVNSQSAACGDDFIARETTSTPAGKHLIILQDKYDYKSANFTAGDLFGEYIKT
ncbi:hypothetical protein BGZ80_010653 [Entomortierella chlamydospora]|uniref:Crinkler effector protein N-terminal domain-containing protein n=1 Tax=Entomortierella chlamydospora TaxID=101097 RepID=A0A9P6T075_9FUNG|nr:hypothetical protein BGZ80_010653 [Entomortierella chlamydospora]